MNIKKVVILTNLSGADKVSVYTDLPSPFPPGVGNDNLVMDFEVQKGKGIQYVKTVFPGTNIEHIDTKSGKHEILNTKDNI